MSLSSVVLPAPLGPIKPTLSPRSSVALRLSMTVLAPKRIDTRSSLLKATSMLEEVALDRYTFTRDAFLQRRRNDIFGGNPPEEEALAQPEVPDKKASP